MYFLNPRPTATSLKHCLQKFNPYFLTIGPYWPQRLQGLAPFPYFRTFLGFIFAIRLSASYMCSEVILDALDSLLLRDVMMFPDLRRADSTTSQPVPWALSGDVVGADEDAWLRHVPRNRYFAVLV